MRPTLQPRLPRRDLERVRAHHFTKERTEYEYETKFQVRSRHATSLQVLQQVRACFVLDGSPLALCTMERGDRLSTQVTFFLKGKTEYSLFRYRGVRMIKLKRHRILKGKQYSVFKNIETLLIDQAEFEQHPEIHHRFTRHHYKLINVETLIRLLTTRGIVIGEMTKERVKDFVIDPRDGRIYAIAITFCTSHRRTQKQLEVEYAGFLPGYPRTQNRQTEILKGVETISAQIHRYLSKLLRPSTERKFEFVQRLTNK